MAHCVGEVRRCDSDVQPSPLSCGCRPGPVGVIAPKYPDGCDKHHTSFPTHRLWRGFAAVAAANEMSRSARRHCTHSTFFLFCLVSPLACISPHHRRRPIGLVQLAHTPSNNNTPWSLRVSCGEPPPPQRALLVPPCSPGPWPLFGLGSGTSRSK